jgi:tRNA1(Val) A37 N6-methylase TrmN6
VVDVRDDAKVADHGSGVGHVPLYLKPRYVSRKLAPQRNCRKANGAASCT